MTCRFIANLETDFHEWLLAASYVEHRHNCFSRSSVWFTCDDGDAAAAADDDDDGGGGGGVS